MHNTCGRSGASQRLSMRLILVYSLQRCQLIAAHDTISTRHRPPPPSIPSHIMAFTYPPLGSLPPPQPLDLLPLPALQIWSDRGALVFTCSGGCYQFRDISLLVLALNTRPEEESSQRRPPVAPHNQDLAKEGDKLVKKLCRAARADRDDDCVYLLNFCGIVHTLIYSSDMGRNARPARR